VALLGSTAASLLWPTPAQALVEVPLASLAVTTTDIDPLGAYYSVPLPVTLTS
jgi:hypothetical protein